MFDPSQFQQHPGTARPQAAPAAPNRSWGALTLEEVKGYLASSQWAARRAEYFDWLSAHGVLVACQVCFTRLTEGQQLEVHHHSYSGVLIARPAGGQYVAWEGQNQLVVLCSEHHYQVHQQLAQLARFEGYLEDLLYLKSLQALQRVQQAFAQELGAKRLGLTPSTPPQEQRSVLPYVAARRQARPRNYYRSR